MSRHYFFPISGLQLLTATRNRLKVTGAITQPCLTPARTSNGSDSWPPMTTLAFIPSWNSRRIVKKCEGQPNLLNTSHSRSRFTVSNALVRSMNAKNRSRCCSRHYFSCNKRATKIMSIVLRPRLNPLISRQRLRRLQ